ncbi:LPS export ABC transporter periplasmic protein LptC [Iocasia frigidifontis]|uniref:LPS export ABC transporter periplasmic protein LptC n=2 Tax=Iocasia fonsfrigidae TaxID=2682810 RepID=A0A8A7KBG6_9FIRM|nr:LPS export ABC transporter periplasmic protein LptC [Iocasia fonsfrigidae]
MFVLDFFSNRGVDIMSGRVFALVLLITVVLISGVYFAFTYQPAVDESDDSSTETLEADTIPENKFKDIDLTVFNGDDSVSWQIKSSDISSFSQGELLKLSPLKLTAYDENDEVLYTITADYCNYRSALGEMEITGSVVMEKDELRMMTAHLDWDRDEELIRGSGGVSFTSPSYQLTGGRFQANTDFSQITVYKDEQERAALLWKEVGKGS